MGDIGVSNFLDASFYLSGSSYRYRRSKWRASYFQITLSYFCNWCFLSVFVLFSQRVIPFAVTAVQVPGDQKLYQTMCHYALIQTVFEQDLKTCIGSKFLCFHMFQDYNIVFNEESNILEYLCQNKTKQSYPQLDSRILMIVF